MKGNEEQIKKRIISDLKGKAVSISWLQKKYKIGFRLAYEIYKETENKRLKK